MHFAKFVAVFLATLDYGIEGAQAVCKTRGRTWLEDHGQLQKTVKGYLCRHYTTLLEHKDRVREVLPTAMNGALEAGMIDLA